MPNKMLIDATHPEETRVVVVRGSRVEDFDFESADRLPLRGNIYLAKVTRVEPSLQAAFIEYGGNRHGFLAFSEIHPDYYQIPVADREALLAEEARAHAEEESGRGSRQRRRSDSRKSERPSEELAGDEGSVEEIEEASEDGVLELEAVEITATGSDAQDTEAEAEAAELAADVDDGAPLIEADAAEPEAPAPVEAAADEEGTVEATDSDGDDEPEAVAAEDSESTDENGDSPNEDAGAPVTGEIVEIGDHDDEGQVEHVGGGDALDDLPERAPPRRHRTYKIQEVIRRRQIMLVQVVKEERGTKGAALTTYLSLAGRYSVLMPNTARGGGISRKITDGSDRKRLREIVDELEVPEGMGIILRTAGASRTKTEIKRDYEYLLRLWETIRDLTLKSTAPALVYEEGSLIKRSIRDLYNKDIDQILVAGDDSYREAKDFMRMLMPSHAKVVQPWREARTIFASDNVEAQLDAMFSPHVTLRSGGYIIINQTEALVAIDVNSGRSTREHNIEDTALRTNLEAAEEVSRQLRLRDLAGLIVIDFIDMEEGRNNRAVERKLKDCLRNDRARIQVGRISHFGLMEMSRQRMRTGVLESSSVPCPHCAGTGIVRSVPSVALHVLRMIDDMLRRDASCHISVRVHSTVALYVLNQKRSHLNELEGRYGLDIYVTSDDSIPPQQHAVIEKRAPVSPEARAARSLVRVDSVLPIDEADEEFEAEDQDEAAPAQSGRNGGGSGENGRNGQGGSQGEGGGRRRRRRRRRGHGSQGGEGGYEAGSADPGEVVGEGFADEDEVSVEEAVAVERGEEAEATEAATAGEVVAAEDAAVAEEAASEDGAPKKRRRGRRGGGRGRSRSADAAEGFEGEAGAEESSAEPVAEVTEVAADSVAEPAPQPAESPAEPVVADPVADPGAEVVATEAPAPVEAPELAAEPEPAPAEPAPVAPEPAPPEEPKEVRPPRAGWWQRKLLG